ncbi:MAG TPA: hypothetical protein VJC16_06690 [Candidatus Nanoarchaeia archaeon]|nr:hypothetical protein [Candidatus Nanoarchaeia archaeon]
MSMTMSMMRAIPLMILLLALPAAFASWGVSYPNELELLPGESGRFKFGIDATQNSYDMECTVGLSSFEGVTITLDSNPLRVKGKGIGHVGGTATIGAIPPGDYGQQFCVTCTDILLEQAEGATVRSTYCNIPFTAHVVGERSRENQYVPAYIPSAEEAPAAVTISVTVIVLVAIGLAVVLSVIFYELRKPRKR